MGSHLDLALLRKLGRGELSRSERWNLVRHLLSGCRQCIKLTARLLMPGGGAAREDLDYASSFARVKVDLERRQIDLATETDAALGLLRELLAEPFERQRLLVAGDPRFRSWVLCEQLLETAHEAGFEDPIRALELARLGTEMAERLDPAAYGAAQLKDLAARAWAALGNAERIRSDFQAADNCFQKAEQLLKAGTGDPLEKARLYLLKISLLGAQQRFPEAFRLLDRVVTIGRKWKEPQLCGKALIARGLLCALADQQESVHRLLAEGLQLVDPAVEPRLVVCARHNLVVHLVEIGRYPEALHLLEETRPLYDRLKDRMNLLRLRWLEGKIALAQGDFKQAETLLLEVRRELIGQEIGYDAALASLDLARIYARQGRTHDMRPLAEEILEVFRSRQIPRETLTALIIFQKAAELEGVTVGLVHELSEYLQRAQKTSGPRFRATS